MKEIIIGQGLGKIKFGLSKEEVIVLVGKPQDTDSFEIEGLTTEAWHYDDMELSLSFDEDVEWRLSTISVSAKGYQLKGHDLIGMEKTDFIERAKAMDLGELTFEDHSNDISPNHHLVEVDKIMMNFWFDNGILNEIQWGPLWEDDETIIWPEL